MDIDKILISSSISSGEKNYKYFIVYMDDDCKNKLLRIILPKTSACVISYNGLWIWRAKDDWRWWIIKKKKDIWNKVSQSIKKELDSKPIYNKKNFWKPI